MLLTSRAVCGTMPRTAVMYLKSSSISGPIGLGTNDYRSALPDLVNFLTRHKTPLSVRNLSDYEEMTASVIDTALLKAYVDNSPQRLMSFVEHPNRCIFEDVETVLLQYNVCRSSSKLPVFCSSQIYFGHVRT